MNIQKNRKNNTGVKKTKLKKTSMLPSKTKTKINENCHFNTQSHYRQPQIAGSSMNFLSESRSAKHLHNHFASRTQLIYSPFQKHYYLPPHLQSTQVNNCVFWGECKQWKVRPQSAKKYDYDQLYETYQQKYQYSKRSGKWNRVQSRIKYLLDEDKTTYSHFHPLKHAPKRQKHPDDDLSEESSVQAQKQ